jgi:hypothetical protein
MNKRIVIALAFLLCTALGPAPQAAAQSDDRRCDNRLIEGVYGFTIEGQKLAGPGPVGPQVGIAITTFDGFGNLTQVDTVVIGGNLVADFTHPPATGTYSVNADCTGTFTIVFHDGRPPVTVSMVVVAGGNEIDTVVLPPPGAVGPLATRSIGRRRFFN